jgi:nicotinate phosphoribosyltransferase
MSFDSELESFAAYATAMPNNGVFLVDTYDTLEGVRHAVEIGRQMRAAGHELAGIRLDSGDLAWLSIEARQILDEAGFPKAVIVASNDLDEHLIESLKQQGSRIGVWGVGTQLVTGGAESALGGVYKLGAIRGDHGIWQPKVKLSEQSVKVSNPGIQQVRRFSVDGQFRGDALFDETTGCPERPEIVDPKDTMRHFEVPEGAVGEDLLVPVCRGGEFVMESPPLREIQARCREQLAALHAGIKRLQNPHSYPAGLERGLAERKAALIREHQKKS